MSLLWGPLYLIGELKDSKFDPKAHKSLKNEIVGLAGEIDNPLIKYQNLIEKSQSIIKAGTNSFGGGDVTTWKSWVEQKINDLLKKLAELGCPATTFDTKAINSWLTNKEEEVQRYQAKINEIQSKYPRANLDLLHTDNPEIEHATTSLEQINITLKQVPFWQFEFLFKKRTKMFSVWLSKYSQVCKIIDSNFYDLEYPDIPDMITGLNSLNQEAASLIALKPSAKILNSDIKKLATTITGATKENEDVQATIKELNSVQQKISEFETPTFADYYRLKTVKEQRKIYELSHEFLSLEMVKRKDDLISTLQDWIIILSGNDREKNQTTKKWWKQKGLQGQLNNLSLAYPVITSTLASYNNFFKHFMYPFITKEGKPGKTNYIKDVKPVHLVLSDESGMCAVHPIFPLLYKSEKAIIVGDPLQLEPIVPVGDIQAEAYTGENYNSVEVADKYSPISVTAYHRAAGCKTGNHDDIGEGIILDEHRRCQEDIAKLFIEVANYSDLQIKTLPLQGEAKEKLDRFGGKNLVFYDVDGQKGTWRNTNNDEVDAIGKALKKLEKAGYKLDQEIGIITPFAAQERLLIKKFSQELGHRYGNAKIGTVHKFQGVEFDVIIFSPVIFSSSHSSWFLNSKPNLINVAISRAKHLFITCGNYQKLFNSGGYLKKLCKLTKESGYLLEGTPDDVIKEKSQGIDYLDTCGHIQYFEDCLQSVQSELTIISPWLGQDQHHTQQLESIKGAMDRGVKTKIYYGWKQGDNDAKTIQQYQEILGKNLIRIPQNTHEKCIIKDRKEMAIGSFNWLSHRYSNYCLHKNDEWRKATIRRESSVIIRDQTTINQVLQGLS